MTQQQSSEFSELAHKHMAAIYTKALGLTKNTVKAEDLVHRTYLAAFNMFDTFDHKLNFEDWLTNLCIKIFRYPSISKEDI